MVKSKKLWGWAGGGLLAVVLVWTGWQVWQVNRDLNDAVRHGQNIQAAVERRDTAALDREFDALRDSSRAAADRTSGVTWSVLTRLPLFGDDAEGIATTSSVLDGLAEDGVEPLVTASDRFEELLPDGGKIDVDVAEDLADPVARARMAFDSADAELSAVDSSGFIGRLDTQFRTFRDQVDQAADALGSAEIATKILPTMLGADAPRHYLLVFENNAEVRGMGGLAGAASYLEVADGKLELTDHVSGGSLGEASAPALPLTDAEKALYGNVFGTYFVNATLTLDVPRAAELLRARWVQQHPEQQVDGVLIVDAVALGYLLEATGPVTVDGVQVTGDNAVDELLNNTYLRLSDPVEQDAFFADVAAATFEKFTAGISNPTGALKALGRAVDERRIAVHSFDAAEQGEISGTAIAGEFPSDAASQDPNVAVTVSDMTGSKMSYYLRYNVDVSATTCSGATQSYVAKARFTSTAPPDASTLPPSITGGDRAAVDPGDQLLGVRIFGPVGGSVSDMRLNGVESQVIDVVDDGRPVAMTYLQLAPGQTVDLAWKMAGAAGDDGDTSVSVTPAIERKDSTQVLSSACAN